MSQLHTCLACGLKDYDVRMTLVEVPEGEQRIIDVAVVTSEDGHGRPTGMETRQVRERFAAEPRCRDKVACREREAAALAEWKASQVKVAPAASDDQAWLA